MFLICGNVCARYHRKRKTCNVEINRFKNVFFSLVIVKKFYFKAVCKIFSVAYVTELPVNFIVILKALNVLFFQRISVYNTVFVLLGKFFSAAEGHRLCEIDVSVFVCFPERRIIFRIKRYSAPEFVVER